MKEAKNILILLAFSSLFAACNQFSTGSTPAREDIKTPGESASENLEQKEIAEVELHTTSEKIKDEFRNISVTIKNKPEVEYFYKNRDFAPAWTETATRTSFVNALQKADEEGLFFKDYHEQEIVEFLKKFPEVNESQVATFDILLTDAFLSYAHDLYYGKLNPEELYKNWGVSRKDKDLEKLLKESLENKDVAGALEQLKPSYKIYTDLKNALAEYKQLKTEEQKVFPIKKGELIKPGETDKRIAVIAGRLQEIGLLSSSVPAQDSIYSENIQESIKTFQKSRGLQVDGIIGNSTIAELNMTPTERYKQLLANLERWRWYPRDLGEHYILINIPDFKLAVVKDGDTVRTHNVIAGSRARQTPIFTDTVEYIVINPQWHIPPTIKYEDVIPRASRDSAYLSSHNMKVIGRDGGTIDPAGIDWKSPVVKSYNFVQRAGPSNPLGQVKIIYPNKYLIYLHDTPAQNLFSQNQRAESSGCVRVENAVDLAGYILNDQKEWDEEKIREVIVTGKTKEVKITRPIQVHHFYWTAWRAGNKTVFTEDVYNLDKEIYSRLLENN